MDSPSPSQNGHKRSKSSIAKNLLSKVTSKSESDARNPSPERQSSLRLSTERSRDITMPRLSLERTRDSGTNRLSMERSRESTAPVAPSPLSQTPSYVNTAPSQPASIESSVKVFRIYEALRSGDQAAISKTITDASSTGSGLQGTTILHLAIQCADDAVVQQVFTTAKVDVNSREAKDGNTPLHIAAAMNRPPIVQLILNQRGIDESIVNYHGKTALDLAKTPEVFEKLQLARSIYIEACVKNCHNLVRGKKYEALEDLFSDDHFKSAVDINSAEMATDSAITNMGGTLLHQAALHKDAQLIELLLLNGADPFKRDRKGKLPQDIADDKAVKALLKKSPAAAAAQRGVQERTILGGNAGQPARPLNGENALGGKEGREMKGYLKKWVNYTTGYKLRWFVLEDGVLSYYKHQDDAGSACRGAINMRIAALHMDGADNSRFEIIGKSSVKYHLKANHEVEAKRWFWALTNAIQHAKDEAKAAARAQTHQADLLKQAQLAQAEKAHGDTGTSVVGSDRPFIPAASVPSPRGSLDIPGRNSLSADDRTFSRGTTAVDADPDDDDAYGDDASSIAEVQPVTKDAFMIASHSARLQLDLLSQISAALQTKRSSDPTAPISDPTVSQALSSYEAAVANLRGLVGDLNRIARDRESHWQYRLEQEVNVRKIWEDNMLKVAQEQEELEQRFGESEEKRRKTKAALRDALENQAAQTPGDGLMSPNPETVASPPPFRPALTPRGRTVSMRRKSTFQEMADIAASESDDEDDEEFFDAVTAGEIEIVDEMPQEVLSPAAVEHQMPILSVPKEVIVEHKDLMTASFKGYEDPIRTRLKLDADDRPKVSLWGVLKSMIGKDMTKMTLPVTFNEPTSLLQRIAEDMEYIDLLDTAASRADSTERMVYVAAFAASEYASTIGRIAKPFNPLLGETYEYARPDKGFRFFIEQVSHHPPVGAAWANAKSWDYFGEASVKSKFSGKSFDINPLGTWFLRLRPTSGGPEELYTWKKVTSSVVGIITGSPTIDNWGPMEIKNHTTGDVCLLDFKQRGWKASSACAVSGKVLSGADGKTCWSIGGKWNERIYARLTPGYVDELEASGKQGKDANPNKAFLVWEAHERPTGVPFGLTPFAITLNALQPNLKRMLPPTDTRLRPDQRCMEDGEYDRAADEKNRVEEKQRAKRRARETAGEEFQPKWFKKSVDPVTKEEYWEVKRTGVEMDYWKKRSEGDWRGCEDIF